MRIILAALLVIGSVLLLAVVLPVEAVKETIWRIKNGKIKSRL